MLPDLKQYVHLGITALKRFEQYFSLDSSGNKAY